MQLGEKPKSLFCYICGREFGTNSLGIHIKNCIKKFEIQQNKKQKSERIALPSPPQQIDQVLNGNLTNIAIYNQKAINTHKYKVLPSCKFCGRTFNYESLKAHQNGCNKKDPKKIKEIERKEYMANIPGTMKKPRTLVCCVCGRQFGLTSLKIHYPKCTQKFKNEEKKKPKAQRKPVPEFSDDQLEMINTKEDWTNEEIEEFNQHANGNYRDNAMVQCENCKRKFFADSYLKHKKNCVLINGKKGGSIEAPSPTYSLPETLKKPRTLTCCVCGREFGLTSLKIHYPQCVQKFTIQQKLKPKNERKPAPNFSEDQLDMINNKSEWTLEQIEQFNQHANGNYRDNAMVQCQNCKRKFFAESYLKHKKNCVLINGHKEGSSSSKSLKQAEGSNGFNSKPRVLMCHICGRQFGLSSLAIHIKQCEVKFLNAQKKKPKQQQKAVPQFPQNQDFDIQEAVNWSIEKIGQYNEIANQVYRQQSLSACPICGRKFFQESLPKHLKFCEKNSRSKSQINKIISPGKTSASMGKLLKRNNSVKEDISNQDSLSENQFLKQQKEQQAKSESLEQIISPREKLQIPEKKLNQKSPIAEVEGDHSDEESKEDQDVSKFQESPKESFLKKSFYRKMQGDNQKHNQIEEVKEMPQQLQETFKETMNDNKSTIKTENNKTQQQENTEQHENFAMKSPKVKANSSKGFAALRKKQSIQYETMKQCSVCNRKFNEDRIQKHEEACRIALNRSKVLEEKRKKEKQEDSLHNESKKRIKNAQQQNLREVLTPEQKVRMGKGFAAPRAKQEQAKTCLKQCKICNMKMPQDRLEEHEKKCEKLKGQKATIQPNLQEIKSLKRVPCPNCNRKFAQERLEKHIEVCAPTKKNTFQKKTSKQEPEHSIYSKAEDESQPQSQLKQCSKCSRKFAENRLAKHEEVCRGKKNSNSENKAPIPQKRTSNYNIDAELDRIKETQNVDTAGLVQCSKCQRKFKEDRISKHEQVCKGQISSRNSSKQEQLGTANRKISTDKVQEIEKQKKEKQQKLKQAVEKSEKEQSELQMNMCQCQKCGRKFAENRIEKHQNICKATKLKSIQQKKPAVNNQNINATPNRRGPAQIPPLTSSRTKNNHSSEKKHEEQLQSIGDDQYVEESLQKCNKCGRSFNKERLLKHQQVCKGSKLRSNIVEQKKRLNNEQLRKTKNQFFNMMKDLQKKKVVEDDIDMQLSEELQVIERTHKLSRKQNKNINYSKSPNKKKLANDKSVVLPKI